MSLKWTTRRGYILLAMKHPSHDAWRCVDVDIMAMAIFKPHRASDEIVSFVVTNSRP